MISAYSLKTRMQNDIFWSQIGNLVSRALFPQWLWRWSEKRAFSRSTSKAKEKGPRDEVVKNGHDLENQAALLHQEFPGVPPPPLPGIECKGQQTEYGAVCIMCKIYRTDQTSENNNMDTKSAQLIVLHLDS